MSIEERRTPSMRSWPLWGEEEERNVLEALRSGFWGLGGKWAFEFARDFARYCGCKRGVPCANGTVALKVALRAVGVGKGDRVVTSPYTFVSTVSVIAELGAVPVLVDLIENGLHMNPVEASEIAEALDAKAVIPVHIMGMPSPMDELQHLMKSMDLAVIEDAAQAHGSERRGRRTGSLGTIGCFSFQSSKVMTAGEGGCLTTDRDDLADLCWSLINCGRTSEKDWYESDLLAYNYRMSEFQAAVLAAQLSRLDHQIEVRQRNYRLLLEELEDVDGIEPVRPPEGTTRFNVYTVPLRLERKRIGSVDKRHVVELLRSRGVPVSPGYTVPLHRHSGVVNYCASLGIELTPLPNAEAAARDVLWIPHHAMLTDEERALQIADSLKEVIKNIIS
ncbi:MAG: DegT/DnrJ/EryC1/StrS family aminotransferase [Thaumarchaeota archaeon]|nr:DegT/DnrJ/EryC1/StrS family aminotransferase [Candidatus Calditenuaceae archaeon]MDW8187669.1 DegT/DnrJ/EryC1/StrS family aminotransferase [Nitrososphaerota archaeon]